LIVDLLSKTVRLERADNCQINARFTHPQGRRAQQAQAQLASARAAALGFCTSASVRRLRQRSAIRRRACAYSNRWRRRDEAGRSLHRSTVHDMPCETAPDGGAFLLVRTAHRSPQRVIAPMDYIDRCKRPGSASSFGCDKRSIWQRHMNERRSIIQNKSSPRSVPSPAGSMWRKANSRLNSMAGR
jgi:hypothetical protein